MYKGASHNLVWRTAVDRAHPSRGYIDGGPDPRDVLPEVAHLTFDQMLAEKKLLTAQLGQIQASIAKAKAEGSARTLAALGQQHQAVQHRAAAINLRLQTEKTTKKDEEALYAAVRKICDSDTRARIFRLAREIRAGTVRP